MLAEKKATVIRVWVEFEKLVGILPIEHHRVNFVWRKANDLIKFYIYKKKLTINYC